MNEKEWQTNRDKKREFKPGYYWCYGCDRELVSDWKKCPTCGHRNGTKKGKKNETSI